LEYKTKDFRQNVIIFSIIANNIHILSTSLLVPANYTILFNFEILDFSYTFVLLNNIRRLRLCQ